MRAQDLQAGQIAILAGACNVTEATVREVIAGNRVDAQAEERVRACLRIWGVSYTAIPAVAMPRMPNMLWDCDNGVDDR
jgi:hypothetical protein